jgi:hypothetical protein
VFLQENVLQSRLREVYSNYGVGSKKKNRKYSSSIALYTYLLLKRKVLLPLSFISFPTSSLERGRFFNKHKK